MCGVNRMVHICAICHPVGWFGNMVRRFAHCAKLDWNFNHLPFRASFYFLGVEIVVTKEAKIITECRRYSS